MHVPHSHDDIELNLLLEGSIEYVMNGHRVRLEPKRLLAFWAAIPHQLVEVRDAEFLLVTIPLTRFMAWSQTFGVTTELLQGKPLISPPDLLSVETARRWTEDLGSDAGIPLAAELEIQATMMRLAQVPNASPLAREAVSAIDRMRGVIAERYAEGLTIENVAKAAAMHPNHAMRAFKRATGSSIGKYILDYRLAHAKRLLAMTDLILPLVAMQAGFGSDRRLFDVFRRDVGMTPLRYRQRARSGENFANRV